MRLNLNAKSIHNYENPTYSICSMAFCLRIRLPLDKAPQLFAIARLSHTKLQLGTGAVSSVLAFESKSAMGCTNAIFCVLCGFGK